MTYLPYLIYVLSALAAVALGVCIYRLTLPFIGWRCATPFPAQQILMDIPKAGRYAVCICRDRFWLFQGKGGLSDAFTRPHFWVIKMTANEQIPYHQCFGVPSSGVGKTARPVGYFDAPATGRYALTAQLPHRFLPGDTIVVRRHLSIVMFFLLVWAIVLCGMAVIGGIIVASLMLARVIPL